jgi:hypothetical protein
MLVACGAGGGNTFTSFEARCSALPAPRFEVVEVPVTYVEDPTQSIDALTAKSGDAPETRLTLGLTTGKFGHETDFELRAVDDPEGGAPVAWGRCMSSCRCNRSSCSLPMSSPLRPAGGPRHSRTR